MARDPYEAVQRSETMALVRGLEQAAGGSGSIDVQWAQGALERLGDLVRIKAPVPQAFWRQLGALDPKLIAGALSSTRQEASEWDVPASARAAHEMDALEFTLRRRDEAHSLTLGLSRVALKLGHGLDVYDGYESLVAALAVFDQGLASVCSRQLAEAVLGTRIVLQDGSTWLASLPETDVEVTDGEPGDQEVKRAPTMLALPSATQLEAYLAQGALRAYVEGVATQVPAFRAELCDALDVLIDAGEQVCFVARLFRRRFGGPRSTSADFRFSVDGRKAAASEPAMEQEQRMALGALPDIAADAILVLRADQLELRVFAEEPLVRVQLGQVEAFNREETVDGVDVWCARVKFDPGVQAVRLVVESAAGARIDQLFEIELS